MGYEMSRVGGFVWPYEKEKQAATSNITLFECNVKGYESTRLLTLCQKSVIFKWYLGVKAAPNTQGLTLLLFCVILEWNGE
jgi:hypothetical protein